MKTMCELSKQVAAPPEKVFAAMSDIEHAPGRCKGILRVEMLTNGPLGVGTKFKETRKMFGKEHTETLEFTAYEPHKRFEIGGDSCGMLFRSEFRFTPEAGGTRMDLTMRSQARTFFAKVMGALCGWMMKGNMKKCIQQDMDDMVKYVESNK